MQEQGYAQLVLLANLRTNGSALLNRSLTLPEVSLGEKIVEGGVCGTIAAPPSKNKPQKPLWPIGLRGSHC